MNLGVRRVLHAEQGFNVLDESDEKNQRRPDEADGEHAFQYSHQQCAQERNHQAMLSDITGIEQSACGNRVSKLEFAMLAR